MYEDNFSFEQQLKELTALTKKTGRPAILVESRRGQRRIISLDSFRPDPGQTIIFTAFPKNVVRQRQTAVSP